MLIRWKNFANSILSTSVAFIKLIIPAQLARPSPNFTTALMSRIREKCTCFIDFQKRFEKI